MKLDLEFLDDLHDEGIVVERRRKWFDTAQVLRDNPGKWACINVVDWKLAQQFRVRLNGSILTDFPPSEFEVALVLEEANNDRTKVFLRRKPVE